MVGYCFCYKNIRFGGGRDTFTCHVHQRDIPNHCLVWHPQLSGFRYRTKIYGWDLYGLSGNYLCYSNVVMYVFFICEPVWGKADGCNILVYAISVSRGLFRCFTWYCTEEWEIRYCWKSIYIKGNYNYCDVLPWLSCNGGFGYYFGINGYWLLCQYWII